MADDLDVRGLWREPVTLSEAQRATVKRTLTADAATCHQDTAPSPTRAGIASGAVGGRYASTCTSRLGLPVVAALSETM